MEGNGTVLTDDHTPLIAHTADDLVTSLTGVYGNDQGIPEANTYLYYRPNGTTDTAGSFGYWTDPWTATPRPTVSGPDHTPNLIDAAGRMAPAPWVPVHPRRLQRRRCRHGQHRAGERRPGRARRLR